MIRAVCALDIPELLTLEGDLFDNAMTERMLQHELSRGWGWVIESVGGGIAGYVLVRKDEELLDITRLGVREGCRGQGFARRLLERAMAEGKDIMLTVRKDNTPAIRLYRKYGFEIVGHLASAGAWVMRLRKAST
jgi:ribosomal protein S18 acetylase RimI-like enzyme